MARLIVHTRPEFFEQYRKLRTEAAITEHRLSNSGAIPGEEEDLIREQQKAHYRVTDCGLDGAINIWESCRRTDPSLPKLFSSWMVLGGGRIIFIDYDVQTKRA